jgi:hypothetical protein
MLQVREETEKDRKDVETEPQDVTGDVSFNALSFDAKPRIKQKK